MLDKGLALNKLLRNTIIDKDTSCWLWQGCTVDGYGQMRLGNIRYYVHRWSAFIYLDLDLFNKNKTINHKEICKNRHCWNPEHIYVGTCKQNYIDAITFGNHTNRR